MDGYAHILTQIEAYTARFYRRQLWLGVLSFLLLNAGLFLLIMLLEDAFWLGSVSRGVLFFSLVSFSALSAWRFVIMPLSKMLKIGKRKNTIEAAKEISQHFEPIQDQLINLLQLQAQASQADIRLIQAALDKKASKISHFEFARAVDFLQVKRYVFLLLVVGAGFMLLSFVRPGIITESPQRIIHYKTNFERMAPFTFHLQNVSVFRGEDYKLSVSVTGDALPESARLIINQTQTLSLQKAEDHTFYHLFEKVQSEKFFQIEAAGFRSPTYRIEVLEKPALVDISITTIPPAYTGLKESTFKNSGDITVYEGSQVFWEMKGHFAERCAFLFGADTSHAQEINNNQFTLQKQVVAGTDYEILLENAYATNESLLKYKIDVIKDEYPTIQAEFLPDSTTFQSIMVMGTLSDDYGLKDLNLLCKNTTSKEEWVLPIAIETNSKYQRFFSQWPLDSLQAGDGDRLALTLMVRDGDPINGFKRSYSPSFILEIPTTKSLRNQSKQKGKALEKDFEKTEKGVENITERLAQIEEQLRTKPDLDWKAKKSLEQLLADRAEIQKKIEALKESYEQNKAAEDKILPENKSREEKNEQFEELMNELLDEETQALYEQLKALLEENASADEINNQLENLQNNEQNLERNLERAAELFKRLKMEARLEMSRQILDSLSARQERAAQESDLKTSKDEQKDIQKEFEDFSQSMKEVMEMNQSLKNPQPLDDFSYEEKIISKELNEIASELGAEPSSSSSEPNNTPQSPQKKSSTGQKQSEAAQKMKNLSKKLNQMQGSMQMEMMQLNLNQLRNILDDLIKLSFNQETLIQDMKEVEQSDPRFLALSRDQLTLQGDAKVIQDSLRALASRVVQISAYVTKEIQTINRHFDQTLSWLKNRDQSRAMSSQRFVLTALNNLALLLDETMQQMQLSMASASGADSGQQPNDQSLPDLQDLQEALGQKMEALKKAGKSGRALSEELAQMAAEQEMIRRQLEKIKEALDKKPGKQAGSEINSALDMMKKNEIDLVNKRLTNQLISRQKQIETRMLEAEKAEKEQDSLEEREAKSPSSTQKSVPPTFEEYQKLQKREIELLKTVPIELNPFYKKEVNDYFRRISRDPKG